MADATSPVDIDKYGVLVRVLRTYYPTAEDPVDRSGDFLRAYHKLGESAIEFKGLEEQVVLATQRPHEFSQVLKSELNLDATADETSAYMIDFYNAMRDIDPSRQDAQQSSEALFDYYVKRPVTLPFSLPRVGSIVPLWSLAVTFLVVAGLGWAGVVFLNYPVIYQVSLALLVLGVIGLGVIAVGMYSLRDEVVNADKYAKRESQLQDYRANRTDKKPGMLSRFRRNRG